MFSYICLLLACKGFPLDYVNVKVLTLNAGYEKRICLVAFLHLLSRLYFSQSLFVQDLTQLLK